MQSDLFFLMAYKQALRPDSFKTPGGKLMVPPGERSLIAAFGLTSSCY